MTCHITADNDHPCLRCGSPFTPTVSNTRRLELENERLRRAIEDFILWWDMPPFALDDDERLRAEVDALRAALDPKVSSK